MAISCCSCNAINEYFGGEANSATSATCGKCGGTSCTASCSAGHAETSAEGKPVRSCSLDAAAQNERAAKLQEAVFSKAVATKELPDGYAIVLPEPAAFTNKLEDLGVGAQVFRYVQLGRCCW